MFGAIRTLDDKGVSSMVVKMHLFADAATARAYIKGLASRFEDSDDLSAFLSACDIVQSVLAYCLIQEISYYRIMEENDGEYEIKNALNLVHDQYRHASSEFDHVKQRLRDIIRKLDVDSLSVQFC